MENVSISKHLLNDIKDCLAQLETVKDNEYKNQPAGHKVGETIPFQNAVRIRRTLNAFY